MSESSPLREDQRTATSVVVVAFNSESTLADCLGSIPATAEVVIVDQCSSDASVSVARGLRPDAKLIRAGKNRGFGAGCNLGAANATGDILIFLNPDAYFHEGAVCRLEQAVVEHRAMVGPKIVDSGGLEQTRARYWSRFTSDLAAVFFPGSLVVGSLRRDIPGEHEVYRSGGPVPYIQGCCMALMAEDFLRVGGFDERFFIYHEEEMLAHHLQKVGVRTILDPRAVVTHIGGVSTRLRGEVPVDDSDFPAWSARQFYRSLALSYVELYPKPVAFAAVTVMWAVLRTMAILTPIRRLVKWRADKGSLWYLSAAAGTVDGWRRRMATSPDEK